MMKDLPDIRIANPRFLFYDYELVDCYNAVKNLYDVFKRVHKRFERRETLTLSKSVCVFIHLIIKIFIYSVVISMIINIIKIIIK